MKNAGLIFSAFLLPVKVLEKQQKFLPSELFAKKRSHLYAPKRLSTCRAILSTNHCSFGTYPSPFSIATIILRGLSAARVSLGCIRAASRHRSFIDSLTSIHFTRHSFALRPTVSQFATGFTMTSITAATNDSHASQSWCWDSAMTAARLPMAARMRRSFAVASTHRQNVETHPK